MTHDQENERNEAWLRQLLEGLNASNSSAELMAQALYVYAHEGRMKQKPKIITRYNPKPIPDFRFDWEAWEDGGDEHMVGLGQTKEEALIDLARLLTERAEAAEDHFYGEANRMFGEH